MVQVCSWWYRYVVRVRVELRVFPGGSVRVLGTSQVRVHYRSRLCVLLWFRNGIQCRHPLLCHPAAAQLHLQYVSVVSKQLCSQ